MCADHVGHELAVPPAVVETQEAAESMDRKARSLRASLRVNLASQEAALTLAASTATQPPYLQSSWSPAPQ
jgi:hypothetical protein